MIYSNCVGRQSRTRAESQIERIVVGDWRSRGNTVAYALLHDHSHQRIFADLHGVQVGGAGARIIGCSVMQYDAIGSTMPDGYIYAGDFKLKNRCLFRDGKLYTFSCRHLETCTPVGQVQYIVFKSWLQ